MGMTIYPCYSDIHFTIEYSIDHDDFTKNDPYVESRKLIVYRKEKRCHTHWNVLLLIILNNERFNIYKVIDISNKYIMSLDYFEYSNKTREENIDELKMDLEDHFENNNDENIATCIKYFELVYDTLDKMDVNVKWFYSDYVYRFVLNNQDKSFTLYSVTMPIQFESNIVDNIKKQDYELFVSIFGDKYTFKVNEKPYFIMNIELTDATIEQNFYKDKIVILKNKNNTLRLDFEKHELYVDDNLLNKFIIYKNHLMIANNMWSIEIKNDVILIEDVDYIIEDKEQLIYFCNQL